MDFPQQIPNHPSAKKTKQTKFTHQNPRRTHFVRPSAIHEAHANTIYEQLNWPDRTDEDAIRAVLSYFLRHAYVPVFEQSMTEAANEIASAPWIGMDSTSIEPALECLIEKRLLLFRGISDLEGLTTLRIAANPNTGYEIANRIVKAAWKSQSSTIAKRKKMLENDNWVADPESRRIVQTAIVNAPRNSTIKLMAYHGRTWLAPTSGISGFLLDVASKRNDLKFRILIVGSKVDLLVSEGATETENMVAISNGLFAIKQQLESRRLLDQFEIRAYGKDPQDALLRGVIVETNNRVTHCIVTSWLFGCERGSYGRQISLEESSSLALLMRDYFDRVFDRSRPVIDWRRKLNWFLVNRSVYLAAFGLIPAVTVLGLSVATSSVATGILTNVLVASIVFGATHRTQFVRSS